ncbi:hypothetical protein [Spirochaeta africana]|uniref:Lipoprotein n=1 Tax=Spirochaeta africana (strain ATCC 700263 / DSM 8902 / Z-7692) TaxID=889378 RepID=H9UJG4_SPIAZ|nr:hypothetical protein [Spirochaeta africana]AFG37657.1 hypothetical protein Spiaf_1599 [Spirochaeta africana DSM 8902]
MRAVSAVILILFLGSCATYTQVDFNRDVIRHRHPQDAPLWMGLIPGLPQAFHRDPIGLLYAAGFIAPLAFQLVYMEMNVDQSLSGDAYDAEYDRVFNEFYSTYWPYMLGNYAVWASASMLTAEYVNRSQFSRYKLFAVDSYEIDLSRYSGSRSAVGKMISGEISQIRADRLNDEREQMEQLEREKAARLEQERRLQETQRIQNNRAHIAEIEEIISALPDFSFEFDESADINDEKTRLKNALSHKYRTHYQKYEVRLQNAGVFRSGLYGISDLQEMVGMILNNKEVVTRETGRLLSEYPEDEFLWIIINEVRPGMSRDAVIESWGFPETINETRSFDTLREQFVYGNRRYVYLENGIVTSVQQPR